MPRVRRGARVLVTFAIALILLCLNLGPHAAAAPLAAPVAALACPVVVKNGGFEAQGANWTQSGAGGSSLITDFNAYRGQYAAELGGVINSDHSIKQTITLPKTGNVRLTFWWEQATQETAPGVYADYLTIYLRKADGTLLKTLDQLGVDPGDPVPPPWEQRAYDLNPYRGQTVQLEFAAHNDESYPTRFYVDDVLVSACRVYLPLLRK